MRRAICFSVVLLLAARLDAAYALVGNTKASAATNATATTPSVDTTGATLLIAVVATYSSVACGAGVTMSDSKANTWTSVQNYVQGTANICTYYAANPTVGTGHTFSLAPHTSGGYPTVFVSYWSGAATTTPKDQHNGAGSASGTTLQTGSITPAENDELLITGFGHNHNLNSTVDAPFTRQDTQTNNAFATGAWAYEIQTTATARNPTWTLTGGVARVANIVSFKASGGGGGSPARRRIISVQ